MNEALIGLGGCTCEDAIKGCNIFAKMFADSSKFPYIKNEKEASTMKVTYNGFTGGLVKLEREKFGDYIMYFLSLYDSEKQATISFTGVKLEDVKFLGGEVAFGR